MKNAATKSIVILSVMCWLLLSLTAYLGFAFKNKTEELSAVSAALVQLTLEKVQPSPVVLTETSDTCPDVPTIDDSEFDAAVETIDSLRLKVALWQNEADHQLSQVAYWSERACDMSIYRRRLGELDGKGADLCYSDEWWQWVPRVEPITEESSK